MKPWGLSILELLYSTALRVSKNLQSLSIFSTFEKVLSSLWSNFKLEHVRFRLPVHSQVTLSKHNYHTWALSLLQVIQAGKHFTWVYCSDLCDKAFSILG